MLKIKTKHFSVCVIKRPEHHFNYLDSITELNDYGTYYGRLRRRFTMANIKSKKLCYQNLNNFLKPRHSMINLEIKFFHQQDDYLRYHYSKIINTAHERITRIKAL